MRRSLPAMLAAAVAVGASTPAAAGTPPSLVTLDGVAGVVPGMTVAQVAVSWGLRARAVPSLCTVVPFRSGAVHGRAMFHDGKFDAVFFDRGVTTPSGIAIGSTVDTLRQTYGRRLLSAPGSHFFFLTRHSSPHWQIRFDTGASDRVVQIGFGDAAVQIVAGCA